MSKNLAISDLLDLYGPMLTDKQRDVIELYYNQDLSLAEIAEHEQITRQGVRDNIKRGEACWKWRKSFTSPKSSKNWWR